MQKFQLRFWHPIAGLFIMHIIYTINENLITSVAVKSIVNEIDALGSTICQGLLLYIIIRNIVRAIKARRSSGETGKLERQREIEKKEVEMVRTSNEILLHLIQDEHRNPEDKGR